MSCLWHFHSAVGKDHQEIVTLLLEKSADVNITDGGGLAPMHWAALFGYVHTGSILAEYGASVNAQTKSGETPLHLAAEKGKMPFVDFLLERGASTTTRDKSPVCSNFFSSVKIFQSMTPNLFGRMEALLPTTLPKKLARKKLLQNSNPLVGVVALSCKKVLAVHFTRFREVAVILRQSTCCLDRSLSLVSHERNTQTNIVSMFLYVWYCER